MTGGTTLIHMPTGTDGRGNPTVQEYYARHFIASWPDDVTVQSITRTIGEETLVGELLVSCTHQRVMDFWFPGLAPTGLRIDVPTIAVVGFTGGLISF